MFIAPKAITPTTIHGGAIAEYENIWANTADLIKKIEAENKKLHPRMQFEPATVIGQDRSQTVSNYRTNQHLGLTNVAEHNEFFRELNNKFYLSVLSATFWYREHFNIGDLHHVEPYNLLRYETGDEYKAHHDGGLLDNRAVSPILYLNDDYEGGHLEFVHHDITIKPKAGSLYLFPSNYPYAHIAHPVTSGRKYAIVTWLHGRIS